MFFEYYLQRQERLRCGYTTGTCSALAAKAATRMLLSGEQAKRESLITPHGVAVEADIVQIDMAESSVRCAVRKDAGDDPDVTDGALIFAQVRKSRAGIQIEGGEGVGRITRMGLEQPVGAAAINRVPREMITREVNSVCMAHGYQGGISVTVSVAEGVRLARKTHNPQLGIEGGISILGTSGIVEPNSLRALVDTIEVELRMLAAQGHKKLILTPGNYGRDFLDKHPPREALPIVRCSNFIGDALDLAAAFSFEAVCLVGHVGKLCKLAAGIMNTHSRFADGRAEVFAAHAALAGGDSTLIRALMDSISADACISLLDKAGLREAVMDTILDRAFFHMRRRSQDLFIVDFLMFSDCYGVLAATQGARSLLLRGGT